MIQISKLFLLLPTLLVTTLCLAQDKKREYEKRIARNEIPEQVLSDVEPLLKDADKVRYYKEYDGTQISYEVKFLWKGRPLSVEFYEDGHIMDIEELLSLSDISRSARSGITKTLENRFSRYRIERLQRQYSAEEDEDEDEDEYNEEVIEEFMEDDTDDLIIRYEMIAQLKGDGIFGPYELLFDKNGNLVNQRKVERRSADNVLY
ncbi:MAG: hypothetical protein ACLFUB_06945 [Cyclobacteriaceae bacterium]